MADTGYQAVIDTPIGRLGIRLRDEQLSDIDWLDARTPCQAPTHPLAAEAVAQLRAYFTDPGHRFDLPLAPAATAFQARVREALQAIPAGEVRRYGELARVLGSAPRAVGGACRRNPVPLVVPCHRVVAAQGLGGFSGQTRGERLAVKQRLLDHERVHRR